VSDRCLQREYQERMGIGRLRKERDNEALLSKVSSALQYCCGRNLFIEFRPTESHHMEQWKGDKIVTVEDSA